MAKIIEFRNLNIKNNLRDFITLTLNPDSDLQFALFIDTFHILLNHIIDFSITSNGNNVYCITYICKKCKISCSFYNWSQCL